MSVEQQIHAIRHSVALSRMEHLSCVNISGVGAFETLDRLCSANLYMQDGQMRETLFLNDSGHPVADVYVCLDDEDFFVLAEGMGPGELKQYVTDEISGSLDIVVTDLDPSYQIVSLNGPYAWELLASLIGAEVLGLPYLTFMKVDRMVCFRAGKTGEYGYDLLVPRSEADELMEKIKEIGSSLDLVSAGLEALDQCALENWFFNIRKEGRLDLTPLELQLQWRVSYQKDYIGSTALKDRRQGGPKSRITYIVSENAISSGDKVLFEGRTIGQVVNTGYSSIRGDWVGLALLDIPFAHSGLGAFCAAGQSGIHPIKTVSPPVIHNLSMSVTPQIHNYETRGDFKFPPIVRGG